LLLCYSFFVGRHHFFKLASNLLAVVHSGGLDEIVEDHIWDYIHAHVDVCELSKHRAPKRHLLHVFPRTIDFQVHCLLWLFWHFFPNHVVAEGSGEQHTLKRLPVVLFNKVMNSIVIHLSLMGHFTGIWMKREDIEG